MGWLAAALTGLIWGLLWGSAKYLLLWRPLLGPAKKEFKPRKRLLKKDAFFSSLETRMQIATGLAVLLDAACLFVLYWLRFLLPETWQAALITAAVTLALSSQIPLLLKMRSSAQDNY